MTEDFPSTVGILNRRSWRTKSLTPPQSYKVHGYLGGGGGGVTSNIPKATTLVPPSISFSSLVFDYNYATRIWGKYGTLQISD